jgi:rhodanese-related sulfurtransferase
MMHYEAPAAPRQEKEKAVTKHLAPIETLEPAEVASLLRAGKILLIDVREPSEYASERIAGALLYPLSTFDVTTLPNDAPRRVVFYCGSGKRSLTAAEHRLGAGEPHAAHMSGGIAAWKAAGLPVISL